MRPRHFYRGIEARLQSGPASSVRFNEAPAFLPGNSLRGSIYLAARAVGFNEAPAFLPGNRSDRQLAWLTVRRASMRPRHFYRGIAVSDAQAAGDAAMLQ